MARIKISELAELNIATLDTTYVVGASGSGTYKIPISRLTSSLDTTFASDLVVNAVSGTINTLATTASLNTLSTSVDSRLDILENLTSSYVSFDSGSNLLLKNDGIINHTIQKSIYIGNDAGKESSGSASIAIGRESGKTSQGTYSLAIGQESGKTSQGNNSVAIGNGAGKINQGESSVSLGVESGNDTQGIYAIGIGKSAGLTNQGESSIAIGKDSGRISQGNYAISIGFESGKVNQSENSIIINATGVELNNTESNSFKIAPIRNLISNDGVLQYNSSTKEVTYNNNYLSTSSFNTFTQSIDNRVDSLESATSSYLTSLNGAISSSSQVIGILSSLNSVSASLISKTGSYATTGSNTFYGDQIFEGNSFVDLNIGDLYGGGIVFYVSPTLTLIAQTSDLGSAYGRGSARPTGSALGDGLSNTIQAVSNYPYEITTAFYIADSNTNSGYTDWYLPSSLEMVTLAANQAYLTPIGTGLYGAGWYMTSTEDKNVRGSDGLLIGNAVSSGYVRLIRQINTNKRPSDNNNTNISITGSLSVSGSITGSTNFDTIVNKPTLISGSSQLTASFDTRYALSGSGGTIPGGTISGSAQITTLGFVSGSYLTSLSGAISSSSQLTSSFDERYTLSGSVQPLPDGLISGSSQLTSSYDTRYALSSSLSSISSSFNSRFNGLVTTGSNTFSGSQIFSGSMTVTSGQVIASTITNNSSSLFLQSGSNLYVQNDGIVEITGSLRVSGLTTFASVGGDEGGEIQFGIPTTNTTLQNRVTTDIFQNRYRIFEGSNDAKGVYIDLSKAPAGNNGEITWKASGILNTGLFVQLDNVKVGPTRNGAGGSLAGLSVGAVSTTFVADISATYSNNTMGGSTATSVTYTTTAANSAFGWGFSQGNQSTYILNDTTNSRVYRITLMIGASFNNNFVSIERLH